MLSTSVIVSAPAGAAGAVAGAAPAIVVSAVVESDAHLLRRPQVVSSGGLRVRVPPGTQRTITVPLRPAAGARCIARFTVAPTKVPGKGDFRRLGVHFVSFRYSR